MAQEWSTVLQSLIGVALGWFLNELSARLRARGEIRRKLGEAIASLMALRKTMVLMHAASGRCKVLLGKPSNFEIIRRKNLETQPHFFQAGEAKDEILDEAVRTVSGVDPVAGCRVRDIVGYFKLLRRSNLEHLAADGEAYVKALSAWETSHVAFMRMLEEIIRRMALRVGIMTWRSVIREFKQEDENMKAAAATVDEMIAPMMSKLLAVANESQSDAKVASEEGVE